MRQIQTKKSSDLHYDYTGVKYDFDIEAYCDGKLILETTLREQLEEVQGINRLVVVRCNYNEFFGDDSKQIWQLPLERGRYDLYIEFNTSAYYNDERVGNHNRRDFLYTLYIDYDYYMDGEEWYDEKVFKV